MNRDIPFDEKQKCDFCDAIGSFDFQGDNMCPECFEIYGYESMRAEIKELPPDLTPIKDDYKEPSHFDFFRTNWFIRIKSWLEQTGISESIKNVTDHYFKMVLDKFAMPIIIIVCICVILGLSYFVLKVF